MTAISKREEGGRDGESQKLPGGTGLNVESLLASADPLKAP